VLLVTQNEKQLVASGKLQVHLCLDVHTETPSKDSAVARGNNFAFSLMCNNAFPASSSVRGAIIVDSVIIVCVICIVRLITAVLGVILIIVVVIIRIIVVGIIRIIRVVKTIRITMIRVVSLFEPQGTKGPGGHE
jgi:hypothetical protein